MRAQSSIRILDASTTPPIAYFCSPGSYRQSISTGKERDAESGNDYFLARYYSSDTGRFLSPDWSAKYEPIPYAKLDDPQTLNLYSYVQNNPLIRFDLDGHEESFFRQILDIVEVSYSEGFGAHVQIQVGHNEAHANLGVNEEVSIGLGGGNFEGKVFGGGEASAKAGKLEAKAQVGVTVSTKDGPSLDAKASVHAGGLHAGGGISANQEGIKKTTDLGVEKTTDSKVGAHIQLVEGVGVSVNLSQASRVGNAIASAFKSAMSGDLIPKLHPAEQKPDDRFPQR